MKRSLTRIFMVVLVTALQACSGISDPPLTGSSSRGADRRPQMTEQEVKALAASYATGKGIAVGSDYKVKAVWHPDVGYDTPPFWSVYFFPPPNGGDMTIWVSEDGTCQGNWEP